MALGQDARSVLAALPCEDGNPWVIAGNVLGPHVLDHQMHQRHIRARLAGGRADS